MKLQNLLTIATVASLITSASASVTIDWITVGNAGNAADFTGYGAVGYEYQIGKYEVTNAQYAEFLNAKATTDSYGLYITALSSYGITRSGSSGSYTYSATSALANRPVLLVTWFDAARFANWLTNGQGNGDTETGAYTLNGATRGVFTANPGSAIRLPTENEWYKAAYYNGTTSTYSLYPNGQNSITRADANYGNPEGDINNRHYDVGTFSSDPSYYGTFDQGGNVREWNDAHLGGELRGFRGGSWNSGQHSDLASFSRGFGMDVNAQSDTTGFRLATGAAIPEPTSALMSALGATMLLRRRRK
jgi:sulfatase modifying factor 1